MVEDAELAAALESALLAPVRVRARRPSPYASSFPLAELDVERGDGRRQTLMWKDLSPASLLPGGRRARADLAPGRGGAGSELRAYDLLDGAGLGTPRRVAALHEGERAWLFLEKVEGARLEHVGELEAWKAAARWLAHAHAELTARADHGGDPSWPPTWRAPARDTLPADPLAGSLAAARARVERLPVATIHGELYATNVLIAMDDAGLRVCALDWETIARGPALLDLAALTAGRWDEPGEPLAEAYRCALPDPPPAAELLADLDACRLLVAAHWLTAPAGWEPPPEQARDWLRDAGLIAGRLPA